MKGTCLAEKEDGPKGNAGGGARCARGTTRETLAGRCLRHLSGMAAVELSLFSTIEGEAVIGEFANAGRRLFAGCGTQHHGSR